MEQTPYRTPFKSGSWSVTMHEHGQGGLDHDPSQAGSYEADQSRLGEIGRSVMQAYDTVGGSRQPRWTRDRVPVSIPIGDSNSTGARRASVTMHTPEGHRLSPEHVQGVMDGTHDPAALREHYADEAELSTQNFDAVRRKRMAAYEGQVAAGVPRDRAGDPGRIVDHR